jgi:hypothetical protein
MSIRCLVTGLGVRSMLTLPVRDRSPICQPAMRRPHFSPHPSRVCWPQPPGPPRRPLQPMPPLPLRLKLLHPEPSRRWPMLPALWLPRRRQPTRERGQGCFGRRQFCRCVFLTGQRVGVSRVGGNCSIGVRRRGSGCFRSGYSQGVGIAISGNFSDAGIRGSIRQGICGGMCRIQGTKL